MTKVYLEVDGNPVPADDCMWLTFSSCGCLSGMAHADQGDNVITTAEEANLSLSWNKAQAKRSDEDGFTYRLTTFEKYRADWAEKMISGDCPHEPKWGVKKVALPDAHVWGTSDRHFGRKTHKKHIVPAAAIGNYMEPGSALCGSSPKNSWSDDRFILTDCVTCRKCEDRAEQAAS